ncbi:MAG: beta-galactosidase GalA [Draconibacterium sp.]
MKSKIQISVLLILFIGCVELVSGQSFRQQILFDANWKFTFGHATDPTKDFYYRVYNDYSKTKSKGINFSSTNFNDSSWQHVNLPHDWAVGLPFSEKASWSHGYKALGSEFPENSVGWYRKTFSVAPADSGKCFEIQFDGIFRDSRIWINGMYLGNNMSGYMGAKFDITDFIDFHSENTITVRVDATQTEGWFYEGAGIYRHVWLNVFNKLHTSPEDVFIYTKSIGNKAEMATEVSVHNRGQKEKSFYIEYEILDRNKNSIAIERSDKQLVPVGENISVGQSLNISKPNLWDTESPYLYTLVTRIVSEGKTLEEIRTRFGVRTFRYEADGFYLNNKKVQIKGVCVHQDHAGVGAALLDEIQVYRIGLLKEMGANAYRTAHNPPTPEVLEACDSLGMLFMNETRLLNSGQEYLGQFEKLIKRDRNHASLFMWCIGNEEELIQTTPVGERIAQTMINLQTRLDPSRVSTYGANVGNVADGVSKVIPVRGFNYNLYGLADYEKEHPNQPVIGTEVASTVSTRGIYLPDTVIARAGVFNGRFIADTSRAYLIDQDFSYPGWASSAEHWFSQTASDNRFMGGFVWTGFDYRGEPTPFSWPNINSHFGVMDVCGFPKSVYYYYKSWWTNADVLHIAPHWNIDAKPGEPVNVWVYSNADSVELFLNEISLGRKNMPKFGHLNWQVNYARGALRAVGYKNGNTFQKQTTTTGAPVKIMLLSHKKTVSANNQDALIVNVSVTDKNGLEVPDANNLIGFEIDGDATIIGVGNGDPSSHEKDCFAPGEPVQRKLFNGKCQVIIRSGSTPGQIQLRATSKGLEPSIIQLDQN